MALGEVPERAVRLHELLRETTRVAVPMMSICEKYVQIMPADEDPKFALTVRTLIRNGTRVKEFRPIVIVTASSIFFSTGRVQRIADAIDRSAVVQCLPEKKSGLKLVESSGGELIIRRLLGASSAADNFQRLAELITNPSVT